MVLKESFFGAARRRTFICCRNVQISASSVARDRSRSTIVQPISLQRSLIPHEDCLILDQLPAREVCDRDRRGFRVAQEPLEQFLNYLAVYAREQAYCHFSPALVANLEQYWNAKNREV